MVDDAPELQGLGKHIRHARAERGLSQAALAERCGLSQAQVSYFEAGRRRPTLGQFFEIARALDVSVQRLTSGKDRPGTALKDLAVELHGLGAVDLWVGGATVPGAFRRPEEVVALALAGAEPDPRVVEAVPALLAWNELKPGLLRAFGRTAGTLRRLAWLADVALTIDRRAGFPGGCARKGLDAFLRRTALPPESSSWDDLGRPAAEPPNVPAWKRWKILYDATPDRFEERARVLDRLRADPDGSETEGRRGATRTG